MKYDFLGWCQGTDSKGGEHDKIWGVVRQNGQAISFWGARTAKLTFKQIDDDRAYKQIDAKRRGGYLDTAPETLVSLDPEFQDRFDEGVILAVMANRFHTAKRD